jgi:hypothetical protein
MADFARWSVAAAPALGWSGEMFLGAYRAFELQRTSSPSKPPPSGRTSWSLLSMDGRERSGSYSRSSNLGLTIDYAGSPDGLDRRGVWEQPSGYSQSTFGRLGLKCGTHRRAVGESPMPAYPHSSARFAIMLIEIGVAGGRGVSRGMDSIGR